FRRILPGRDGRIWVLTSQPAEPEADAPPADPLSAPAPGWRERVVFDVFEADGTYLGQVAAPPGLATRPAPVFSGDRVWAVIRDGAGAERVVRFRIAGVLDTGADRR
ncbi:MAG TPA: hypothetical protein VK966_05680, partial [Longimicrobiales bacterium]|nr:hypothetical protein [Longimicrobiales bacterium]